MNRLGAQRTLEVRYAAAPGPGETIVRRFLRPAPIHIVAERGDDPPDAERTLLTVMDESASAPVAGTRTVKAAVRDFATVTWRPGAIEIVHPRDPGDQAIAAALAFDHLVREADSIASVLAELEPTAQVDVGFSYRIRTRDRANWDRQFRTMESLSRLRLRLAQVVGLLDEPADDLGPNGEQLFRTLIDNATLTDRLQSLSDRLEPLEDLYEGAVDRINDHAGWRQGHWMELIIIIVLVVETALAIFK